MLGFDSCESQSERLVYAEIAVDSLNIRVDMLERENEILRTKLRKARLSKHLWKRCAKMYFGWYGRLVAQLKEAK